MGSSCPVQNINTQQHSACFSTSAFQGLTKDPLTDVGIFLHVLSFSSFPCVMSLLDPNLDLLELEIAKPSCPLGVQRFSSIWGVVLQGG